MKSTIYAATFTVHFSDESDGGLLTIILAGNDGPVLTVVGEMAHKIERRIYGQKLLNRAQAYLTGLIDGFEFSRCLPGL